MGVGGGGTHFPICFTAALPMDLQLIGPELVVEIRVEIKRRKHTYSRNSDTESYIVNITVLISMALEGGGPLPPLQAGWGGGHVPLVPPCFRHL